MFYHKHSNISPDLLRYNGKCQILQYELPEAGFMRSAIILRWFLYVPLVSNVRAVVIQSPAHNYDSMLVGGVTCMMCSTWGALTPIPRDDVANNTLILEFSFFISEMMLFIVRFVWGAWNRAKSLAAGSFVLATNPYPLKSSRTSHRHSHNTYEVYNSHGILLPL